MRQRPLGHLLTVPGVPSGDRSRGSSAELEPGLELLHSARDSGAFSVPNSTSKIDQVQAFSEPSLMMVTVEAPGGEVTAQVFVLFAIRQLDSLFAEFGNVNA